MDNKKILITGGAGFIGSKICERLHANNKIYLYDKLERNAIRGTEMMNHPNITLIQGDILDKEKIMKVISEIEPEIVIHMAAIAGIDNVINRPIETLEVNFIGTYNLLKALEPYMKKVERFIDFSTSEVFGSYAYKVSEEDTTNLAPVGEARWTYQVSKIASEHLAHSYYKKFGLPVVSIRPFNIYGPGQVGEGAIQTFVKRAIKNETLYIHGEGDQIRAWCYIDDIIDAIMLCLEKKEAIGHSFNIGNPRTIITISMLAQFIKMISQSESEIIHVPKTYVDVEMRIPDIDKAKELLGYNPRVDLNEGIQRTIDWFRGQEHI